MKHKQKFLESDDKIDDKNINVNKNRHYILCYIVSI